MEFEGPFLEKQFYISKFVRAGEKVYVTKPNDQKTFHSELAESDGIAETIRRLRIEDPVNVDGGYITVDNVDKYIIIDRISPSLDLPISKTAEEARRLTGESVRILAPEYSVNAELF